MTYTAPTTRTTGTLITAAIWNTYLGDNISHLYAGLQDYILVRDEKAANTDGGTFTAGSWQTRDLNTEVVDIGGHVAVASNQMTMAAGTYECVITAPACGTSTGVGLHQARLYNITQTAVEVLGTTVGAANASGLVNLSVVAGRFAVAASDVLEVQHRCTVTRSTDGFGIAANIGNNEIYTVCAMRRVDD